MTTNTDIRKEIIEIIKDETLGINLRGEVVMSEKGIDKLMALFSSHLEEIIGEDEEVIEENVKTVDGSYDITTDLSETRNNLRAEMRASLKKI